MGKMKNKRVGGAPRVNPVGLPSLKDMEKLEADGDVEVFSDDDESSGCAFVQTLLEQLDSHLVEERDSGLNSLSVACQKTAYLQEIAKSDVIKTVGPLLLDPSASVRHSAAGALRNLSCTSPEFCEFMVKQDVMTPLVTLIKQKYGEWTPPQKEKKETHATKIDTATETFIEAVTLLWNLCESSPTALKIFNRETLGDMLCRYLNTSVFGVKIAVVVAQCLYTATEDNSEALSNATTTLDNNLYQIISTVPEAEAAAVDLLHLKTLSLGILLNLNKGDASKITPLHLITQVLSAALEVDHFTVVNKFSSEIPITTTKESRKSDVIHSHREGEDEEFKKIFYLEERQREVLSLISCQTLALEILSNVLFTEDGDSEDDDVESEEGSVCDLAEDVTDCADVEMEGFQSGVPSEIYEGITSNAVLNKVLSKVKAVPVNVLQILSESKEYGTKVVAHLTRQRCTALLCLQNLIEGLQFSDIESSMKVVDIWTGLGAILVESDPSSFDVIEAVTSAMRAIVQKWTTEPKAELCEIFASAFQVFYDAYTKVEVPKVRVNIIKIIGGMGLLSVKFGQNSVDVVSILKQVGTFLITCLPGKIDKESLWIVAEVLDTIFDVFGEDDYNKVLTEIGLIAKLNVIQPQFRKQVRNERRSLGEYKAVIQTANTNLPRFIKYKTQHGVS